MPIRKKADLLNLQNLEYIKIDDSLLSNELFDIIDFPEKLTAGKNLFKIRMQNGRFVDGSEVYIDIVDFNGNAIYYEPLRYVEKDGTRVISIYVYPDTPPGPARVFIAGRLAIDDDGQVIEFSTDPNAPNFRNIPNALWSRSVPVAPSAFNTSEIIFTKQPSLTITEIVQPFRQPVSIDAIFTNQTRPNSSVEVLSATTTQNNNTTVDDGTKTVTGGSLSSNSPSKNQGAAIVDNSGTNKTVSNSAGTQTTSATVRIVSGFSILNTTNFPLSASMQGGQLTIVNPTISVPANTILNSAGQVLPESQVTALSSTIATTSSPGNHPLSGSYVFHIDTVLNKTKARISQISGFKNQADNTFGAFAVKVSKTDKSGLPTSQETISKIEAAVNVTASFIKPSETILTENSASFADIIIADTEPETGDVYRIKTLFKPSGQFGDFLDLGDTILEQQNILIDETSLETNVVVGSFYENFGQFESLQEIQKYWSSSVAGGLPFNALVPEYNVDDLIGGVSLVTNWNNNTDQFTAAPGDATIFQIRDQYKPRIYANTTYIVRFKTTVPSSIVNYQSNDKNIPDPRLDLYINNNITTDNPISEILIGDTNVPTGFKNTLDDPPFNNRNELGTRIGTVLASRNASGDIATVELQFKAQSEENLDIRFVLRNGLFIVSDIEVLADKETGYSPNFVRLSKRIPMEHMHTPLSFKFQYFDIRGNKADLETVAFGAVFDGDNNYIQGTSNLLTGSMFIGNQVASGIEMGGLSSGFIRSVGYEGLDRAIAGTGPGGFLLYSGSGQMQIGDNIEEGVGLQLVGDNDSSHLIFTTRDGGSVDIKAEKFFIGSENTQFISGSEGNIEISSSLFHLDPQNDLLVIGADAVINADLTVNSLRTPATIGGSPSTTENASSSIDSDGFAKFASASIAGFEVVTDEIRSSNEALRLKASGDITASRVLLEGGTITSGVTILGSLSANSILTPATINGSPATPQNASSSISDQGLAIFRSASIAGFDINPVEIKSPGNALRLKSAGQITASDGFLFGNKATSNFVQFANNALTVRGNLSVDQIFTPSIIAGAPANVNNASSSITSDGFAKFTSASIAGFVVNTEEIKSSNESLRLKSNGQITGSNVLFSGGTIGGFDLLSNELKSSNNNLRLKDSGQITGSTVLFTGGKISGSAIDMITPKFFLGSDSQFVSGANGNIEISSSNFHLDNAGNVNMSGKITATEGSIGGFVITENAISSSNGNLRMKSSGQITGSNVLFTGGEIGGFTIDNDHIVDSGGNLQLTGSSGTIKARAGTIGGFTLSSDKITGNNIVIDSAGSIQTADYASDLKGWKISSDFNGFAEFENAKIRGTLATAVFEKETVNAVGGQLYVANSTNLTASADTPSGNYLPTDATMSVVNVSGFSANEILSLKKVSGTGFSTEYVKVVSSSRQDITSETNLSGQLFLIRGYGATFPAGPSASLGDTPGGAQSYSGSQVIVSTGKIGTGFIRLNANPNNLATPYIDIVERTGSGVYDVQLKARLGDLSGLANSNLVFNKSNPGFGLATDNVFLQGGITATFGTIGGFAITSNAISSSNNNLILRDSGQITGSTVLFTGGDIGGFVLSSDEIRSSNNNLRLKANGQITASEAQITGKITATEGTIGGFNIGTNLESSAGTLKLKGSTGQITGSDVLFDGGKVGGWSINANQLSANGIKINAASGYIEAGTLNNVNDIADTSTGFFANKDGEILLKAGATANKNYMQFKNGILDLNTDKAIISGSDVTINTPSFFLGSDSQFVSGSNGNIEISSSKIHIKPDGDAIVRKINAVEGSVGGFDINSSRIEGNDVSNFTVTVTADGAQGEGDNAFVISDFSSTPSYPGGANALLNAGGLQLVNSSNNFFFDINDNPVSAAPLRDYNAGTSTIRIDSGFTISGDGDGVSFTVNVTDDTSVTPFVVGGSSTNFLADATAKSLLIPSASYGETGIQLEYNSGTPRFFAGNQTGGFFKFDGTSTQISSSNFNIASNGDVSMAGTVTATAGQIGGFAITPTAISSSNDNLILRSSGQITGSNVKFDGGEMGGTTIESDKLKSTSNLVSPDSSPTFQLDSSGTISGSNLYVRKVLNLGGGNEIIPLLDTRIGLLDGRNLGRQLVSNYDEFVRSNVDDGSAYVTVNEHFVHLLPYENTLYINYQLRVDATTNGVQGRAKFQLQKMIHSGSFTAATNFDNFTDVNAVLSTSISRNSSGTSLFIGAGDQGAILTIPESAQAQTCRIQVEMLNNMLGSATPSPANKTTLKGYSIIATRALSANTAGQAGEKIGK